VCVKYAVEELGADAVGYTMYAGSDYEDQMWKEFREVQEQARKYDVPVVMWAYPRGHGIEENSDYDGDTDPAVISYAARLGLELGADMVKCKYPGQEGWEQVESVTGKMKTVMSGGSKRSDKEFWKTSILLLKLVETVLQLEEIYSSGKTQKSYWTNLKE